MKRISGARKFNQWVAAGLSLLCVVVLAQASESGSGQWTLDNTVRSFDKELAIPTDAGSQFWFVDKQLLDGRTLKMSVVAPGKATHAPHQHAEDELFFVLEGQAEFHLNGKVLKVGPYTSLYCPPQSLHGIRNIGETELKYLVIKQYLNVQ